MIIPAVKRFFKLINLLCIMAKEMLFTEIIKKENDVSMFLQMY